MEIFHQESVEQRMRSRTRSICYYLVGVNQQQHNLIAKRSAGNYHYGLSLSKPHQYAVETNFLIKNPSLESSPCRDGRSSSRLFRPQPPWSPSTQNGSLPSTMPEPLCCRGRGSGPRLACSSSRPDQSWERVASRVVGAGWKKPNKSAISQYAQ